MSVLKSIYESLCQSGKMSFDPAQAVVFEALDALMQRIIKEEKKRNHLFSRFRKNKCVKGLYIYGHVGAGKSFMMDTFYQALPITTKARVHFHAFMKSIHEKLKEYHGEVNPIKKIIHDMAKNVSVLCFDEFIVTDIADAMTLQRVLTALFEEGICLVLTSNTEPDALYLKGLQRHSFLPTIPLIKKHMQVIACEATQDYRLRYLENAGTYHYPLNVETQQKLQAIFEVMKTDVLDEGSVIMIEDRPIPFVKSAGDCIWFEFSSLCHPPRSQLDYLSLVKKYKTIFVSNIPVIQENQHNIILLFIRLIDILYDAKCQFICSAEAKAAQIYPQGRFLQEYQRTCSRLTEMQSKNYTGCNSAHIL